MSHSLVRRVTLLGSVLLASSLLLPSCAYMQTNKSVRELAKNYKGYKLEQPRQLYRSGGTWYVAATPAEYHLSHDFVHDNVFYKTNDPVMKLRETGTGTAYHAISASTATVLMRPDGYVDSAILAQELMESNSPWLSELPHATTHAVQAQLVGEEQTAITYSPDTAENAWLYQFLGGLDFLVVDVPGTVIYNVAVPFMAPFVFFHEFLSE